jgi:hypothetical protein
MGSPLNLVKGSKFTLDGQTYESIATTHVVGYDAYEKFTGSSSWLDQGAELEDWVVFVKGSPRVLILKPGTKLDD